MLFFVRPSWTSRNFVVKAADEAFPDVRHVSIRNLPDCPFGAGDPCRSALGYTDSRPRPGPGQPDSRSLFEEPRCLQIITLRRALAVAGLVSVGVVAPLVGRRRRSRRSRSRAEGRPLHAKKRWTTILAARQRQAGGAGLPARGKRLHRGRTQAHGTAAGDALSGAARTPEETTPRLPYRQDGYW